MKKYMFKLLLSISTIGILASCGKINESEKSQNTSTQTSENQKEYEYILEDGEKPYKFNIETSTLVSLPASEYGIEGINELYSDPFSYTFFAPDVSIRYPNEQLLEGKCIIYTSKWYKQTTAKRNDDVVEYVLLKEDDIWFVDKIMQGSENFIPFNGAILQVPKGKISYEQYDQIVFNKGSIPTYKIGFYNQDGHRVAIETANETYFDKDGINLVNHNVFDMVTNTAFEKVAGFNCVYDEINNCYKIDKFRVSDKNAKIYTNVNDGFMLFTKLVAGNQHEALFEGVRFNVGDTIKAEANSSLFNNYVNFELGKEKIYYCADGTAIKFIVTKTESDFTNDRWKYEIGVDKKGRIISFDDHLRQVPDGGYKFIISGSNGTTSELTSHLIDEIFKLGSRVTISNNNITIDNGDFARGDYVYKIANDELNNTLEELKTYNYGYDIDSINQIKENLDYIKEQLNITSDSDDPTNIYRYTSLVGDAYFEYNKLLGAKNRNEAVFNKSVWYISHMSDTDKDLDSIIKELTKIKNSGVNEIIINPIVNGYAYYEGSKYFTFDKKVINNDYGKYGHDYIKAIVSEAHNLGLKVQADFVPFTNKIEVAFNELYDCFALSVKGEDYVISSQGKVSQLDPANSLVQQRICDTVNDLLTCIPEIDGIHLDYIRYGADNDNYNTVMGVTEAARVGFNEFLASKGQTDSYSTLAELITGLKTSRIMTLFNQFEQELITNTVKNIKNVCLDYNKPLTCAIADNYSYVKTWKCQDWGSWAKLGYVDVLYLMDYYIGGYWVDYYYKDMVDATDNSCLFVTGLSPTYGNVASSLYSKYINGATSGNECSGYATFGSHTNDAKKDAWQLYSYSNWYDSATIYDSLETIVSKTKELLLYRCNNIYKVYGNQNDEQINRLSLDMDKLLEAIAIDNKATCDNLCSLILSMKENSYANNEANNRINEQLDYLYKVIIGKKNFYKN